jgi:hypothetical protein
VSHPTDTSVNRVGTAELCEVLERLLSDYFGTSRHIAQLHRHPWYYSTSFFIEELDVVLEDGERLVLMFKNVSSSGLMTDARTSKPDFVHDPLREIEVYRSILAHAELETATCYGTVADKELNRFWIFLEQVPGLRLNKMGEFEVWQQVAGWLARMHNRLAGQVMQGNGAHYLLRYDDGFYRRWLQRALGFAPPELHRDIERIAAGYEPVVKRLLTLPVTIIHGEFFPFNVLVQKVPTCPLRVCVIDWETAAVGPALMDLAALTAGKWSEDKKNALALAYYAALPPDDPYFLSPDTFSSALDACRLHMCIQWLGWSVPWAQRHGKKWLAEALPVAERLGL